MRPILDDRSERNIATLHPDLINRASAFISAAKNLASQRGLDVKCVYGLRTWSEQEALYAKGRTAPGKIVTKAPAGHSMHNFGLALDIGVFSKDGKTYYGNHALYRELGPLGESLGFGRGNDTGTNRSANAAAKTTEERSTQAAQTDAESPPSKKTSLKPPTPSRSPAHKSTPSPPPTPPAKANSSPPPSRSPRPPTSSPAAAIAQRNLLVLVLIISLGSTLLYIFRAPAGHLLAFILRKPLGLP